MGVKILFDSYIIVVLPAENVKGLMGMSARKKESRKRRAGLSYVVATTAKRAADNKRRYAPREGSIPPFLLSRVSKGACPLAHDIAYKVWCVTRSVGVTVKMLLPPGRVRALEAADKHGCDCVARTASTGLVSSAGRAYMKESSFILLL